MLAPNTAEGNDSPLGDAALDAARLLCVTRYFVVGRIGKDQVEDYAKRKGWDLATAEKWLSPNLGYEPED